MTPLNLRSLFPLPSPTSPTGNASLTTPISSPLLNFDFGSTDSAFDVSTATECGSADFFDFGGFDETTEVLSGEHSTSERLPSLMSPETEDSALSTQRSIDIAGGAGEVTFEELCSFSPFQPESKGTSDRLPPGVLVPSGTNPDVVYQYMRRAFNNQFSVLDETTRGQIAAQLLSLVGRSQSCLSALGLHGVNRTGGTLGGLCLTTVDAAHKQAESYMGAAMLHLDDTATKRLFAVSEIKDQEDHLADIEVQICAAQIIYHKIVSRDNTWNAQIGSLASLAPVTYGKSPDDSTCRLGVMQDLLVSLDTFACASTGEQPIFARKCFDKFADSEMNLECVSGCSTTVMRVIAAIGELQAWKHQQTVSDSLSLIELARRGAKLEADLLLAQRETTELTQHDTEDTRKRDIHATTKVFAKAASVYLHATVSGARPKIAEIEKGVAGTIEALQRLPNTEMIKSLSWPICIAACLAEGDHRKVFERFEQGILDEFGRKQRVSRAFTVAREVWRLRETGGCKPYDWRDGMASLSMMVLLL